MWKLISGFFLFLTSALSVALGIGVYELIVGKVTLEVFVPSATTLLLAAAISLIVGFSASKEASVAWKEGMKKFKMELKKKKGLETKR